MGIEDLFEIETDIDVRFNENKTQANFNIGKEKYSLGFNDKNNKLILKKSFGFLNSRIGTFEVENLKLVRYRKSESQFNFGILYNKDNNKFLIDFEGNINNITNLEKDYEAKFKKGRDYIDSDYFFITNLENYIAMDGFKFPSTNEEYENIRYNKQFLKTG